MPDVIPGTHTPERRSFLSPWLCFAWDRNSTTKSPWLPSPDPKPTPAWLGGWMRWRWRRATHPRQCASEGNGCPGNGAQYPPDSRIIRVFAPRPPTCTHVAAPPIERTRFIVVFSRVRAPRNAKSRGLGPPPPPSTCAHDDALTFLASPPPKTRKGRFCVKRVRTANSRVR